MKEIPLEVVIPLGEVKTLYSDMLCHVRVADEAGGPFLVLRGEYNGDDDSYKESEFALDSHEQIDQFAAVLHRVLKDAEESSK